MTRPFDHSLDVRGCKCPQPLLQARIKLKQMAKGEVLQVVATDPASVDDFEVFSTMSGYDMLATDVIKAHYYFWIQA
jgi:tRNA 2-thiouridine synthesizing protein A